MMSTSVLTLLLIASFLHHSESACARVCDIAIGSYYVSPGLNLSYIFSLFGIASDDEIRPYNPGIINNNFISSGSRINVSIPCNCINDEFLGHTFTYVAGGNETYERIVDVYSGLTNSGILQKVNSYPPKRIFDGGRINVTVACFCGNRSVSVDYGLFVTYPLRDGDSLKSLAEGYGFSGEEDLLQRYNPGTNFSAGEGIVFIPIKDSKGSFRPLVSSNTSGWPTIFTFMNMDWKINEKSDIIFNTSSLSRIIRCSYSWSMCSSWSCWTFGRYLPINVAL